MKQDLALIDMSIYLAFHVLLFIFVVISLHANLQFLDVLFLGIFVYKLESGSKILNVSC